MQAPKAPVVSNFKKINLKFLSQILTQSQNLTYSGSAGISLKSADFRQNLPWAEAFVFGRHGVGPKNCVM